MAMTMALVDYDYDRNYDHDYNYDCNYAYDN